MRAVVVDSLSPVRHRCSGMPIPVRCRPRLAAHPREHATFIPFLLFSDVPRRMKRSALPSKSMDNPAAVFIRFAIGFSRRSVKAGHPFAAIATHYSPRRTQSSDWDVILFLVGHENLQEVTPWIRKGPGAVNSWCQRDSQRERSFKSTKSCPLPLPCRRHWRRLLSTRLHSVGSQHCAATVAMVTACSRSLLVRYAIWGCPTTLHLSLRFYEAAKPIIWAQHLDFGFRYEALQ